jgi:glycerol uptake facilitator-like aquaporin
MWGRFRAPLAEFIGTGGLVAAVVGSGIMGERLAEGNMAIALMANAVTTGLALYLLISLLAPVSGAHFNPAVTIAEALRRRFAWRRVPPYLAVQFAGAIAGVFLAHAMFDLPILQAASRPRFGAGQIVSEVVATAGLLFTIAGFSRFSPKQTAAAVGAFIAAAYWFTGSTSFANPAVTMGRAFTDSFSGIRGEDVPGFIAAQIVGAGMALLLAPAIWPDAHRDETAKALARPLERDSIRRVD